MAIDQTTILARATPEGEAEYLALVSELRQVWPDLEPIPGQPSLSKRDVHSGVWIVGRLDYHAESETYRTFRVLRQVWIPVLFLGAYRVWEGPSGSLVFVGRHPLLRWAQGWNAVGGLAIGALVYAGARGMVDGLRYLLKQ